MSGTPFVTAQQKQYRLVSPNGRAIEVIEEVFQAFLEALSDPKFCGRLEVDCRKGGIAGVRVQRVLK